MPVCIVAKERVDSTQGISSDEVERVTGMRHSALKPYVHNLRNALHQIWMTFLTMAPRPAFVYSMKLG